MQILRLLQLLIASLPDKLWLALLSDSFHTHNGVRRVMLWIFSQFNAELFGPLSPDTESLKGSFFYAGNKPFSPEDNYWMVKIDWFHLRSQLRELRKRLWVRPVAHLNSMSAITFLALLALKGRRGRPAILFEVHSSFVSFAKNRFKNPIKRLLVFAGAWVGYRFHAWASDFTIYPSEEIRDELAGLMGLTGRNSCKAVVWSAPVVLDPPERRPWVDSVLGELPESEPYFAYAGRLTEEKGLRRLIQGYAAFRRISRRKINLAIAGYGDYATWRQVAKEEGVEDSVFFLEQLTEGEVTALAEDALLGASGCPHEAQGLAVLKQMATGRPMVAYEGSIIAKFIKECGGGLVLTGNFEEDAYLLDSFLANEKRVRQCGENAAKYVREHYSPRIQAFVLLTIYAWAVLNRASRDRYYLSSRKGH